MSEIEFNNGFVTALVLFYGHRTRCNNQIDKIMGDMRLYGATDHLYDLEMPKNIPKDLKKEIKSFTDNATRLRLERPTEKEAEAVFDECRDILKKIDTQIFKLKVTVNYP